MRLVSQFQQDGHKNKQKDGLLSRLSALQGHIYTPDDPSASCDEEVGGQTTKHTPPWRAIYTRFPPHGAKASDYFGRRRLA